MKVITVNCSPHEHGCTARALDEIDATLREEGIGAERFWIGSRPIMGCMGCGKCAELGRCFYGEDRVNEFVEMAGTADGFVFGAAVHYASPNGAAESFLDRAFFSASLSKRRVFRLKPAASVAAARRGGTTATFDALNKYPTISEMVVISSNYWNMIHGSEPEDAEHDEEGLQTMRVLARNMAWFLRIKEAGERAGVPLPKTERKVLTNFIR